MSQRGEGLNLSELQRAVHMTAQRHGWWDEPRSLPEMLCLVHSEVSEALESYRAGWAPAATYHREDGKPEGIPSELADIVIRVLDMCEWYHIDLESVIVEKTAYNETRSHRHGGKVL